MPTVSSAIISTFWATELASVGKTHNTTLSATFIPAFVAAQLSTKWSAKRSTKCPAVGSTIHASHLPPERAANSHAQFATVGPAVGAANVTAKLQTQCPSQLTAVVFSFSCAHRCPVGYSFRQAYNDSFNGAVSTAIESTNWPTEVDANEIS